MSESKEPTYGAPELPMLPDFPESPLPGWQHHGLLDYVGTRVQEELERIGYPGCLVYASVAYTLVGDEGQDGETYAMTFGKDVYDDDDDDAFPLSDEFMLEQFYTVNRYVYEHARWRGGQIDTAVSFIVTGSRRKVTFMCRIVQAGECNQGHNTTRQTCKRVNKGPWRCCHSAC